MSHHFSFVLEEKKTKVMKEKRGLLSGREGQGGRRRES
jgi:hypothetical protein